MQENELVFKSGRELGAMIRSKQISPVESSKPSWIGSRNSTRR